MTVFSRMSSESMKAYNKPNDRACCSQQLAPWLCLISKSILLIGINGLACFLFSIYFILLLFFYFFFHAIQSDLKVFQLDNRIRNFTKWFFMQFHSIWKRETLIFTYQRVMKREREFSFRFAHFYVNMLKKANGRRGK